MQQNYRKLQMLLNVFQHRLQKLLKLTQLLLFLVKHQHYQHHLNELADQVSK